MTNQKHGEKNNNVAFFSYNIIIKFFLFGFQMFFGHTLVYLVDQNMFWYRKTCTIKCEALEMSLLHLLICFLLSFITITISTTIIDQHSIKYTIAIINYIIFLSESIVTYTSKIIYVHCNHIFLFFFLPIIIS